MKAAPLRDRLPTNSPNAVKNSILRDSGMGWNSPPSSSSATGSDPTSPVRQPKRDQQPTQADLARRSSSSYRAMRTNNLVSKSPFKSQIPTPSTPSRQPLLFPTRRVSGEKRPRPMSMHDQAEEENERPFALKRERKQSKTYQGLIEKEPVTKSPFRRTPSGHDDDDEAPLPPVPQLEAQLNELRQPSPTFSSRIPVPGASPLRPSLVSKRMHGPRLSSDKRRPRRKTVTWDENMYVEEIDRIDYDEEAVDSEEEGSEDDDMDDPFFQGPPQNQHYQHHQHEHEESSDNQNRRDDSYESLEMSDSGHTNAGLRLDGDTSINGLVEDLFAGHGNVTSTPPREHHELPADLEMEDGIPLGRSHHRERTLKYHQQLHNDSPAKHSPIPFNHPIAPSHEGLVSHSPLPPSTSTPPNRSLDSSPPLGRSTHAERLQAARSDEHAIDKDVELLPDSPSPVKAKPHLSYEASGGLQGVIPKFDLGEGVQGMPDRTHTSAADLGDDPFAMQPIKDERLPEEGNSSYVSASSLNGNDNSGMNLSAMEKELGQDNERLIHTIMEGSVSPMPDTNASFSQSPIPPVSRSSGTFSPLSPTRKAVRRSPLPPIPAGVAPHPMSSPVGLAPRSSPSPRLRPRISKEDVRMKLMGARTFGSGSPIPNSPHLDEGRGSREGSPRPAKLDKGKGRAIDDILDEDPPQGIRSPPQESSFVSEFSVEEAIVETATAMDLGVAQHHRYPESDTEENQPVGEEEEDVQMSEQEELDDAEEFGARKAPPVLGTLGLGGGASKFQLDFGSRFGKGLGLDLDDDDVASYEPSKTVYNAMGTADVASYEPARTQYNTRHDVQTGSQTSRHSKSSSTSSNMVRMGATEEDVSMDMRSALDRLMEDVGGNVAPEKEQDHSMATTEEDVDSDDDQPLGLRVGQSHQVQVMMERPAGAPLSRSASESSSIITLPALPPKDAIRAREAMILERRREMRRMEEEQEDMLFGGGERHAPVRKTAGIGMGRPSRRRSLSTGDAHDIVKKGQAKLDVDPVSEEDPLELTIERELLKRDDEPKESKKEPRKKYQIREREAIYASSDVSHLAGPGDVNVGKAWRTIRRPSDMNEYAKEIKEYRTNQNPGKAYGKVFVKVVGVKNLHIPIPEEPTAMSCTLNNGIHFVTTPECRLAVECAIAQEFELIEHSKLEWTLTLKIRRDPHIIAQFKALAPPPLPQPPPMVQQTSSSSSGKHSSRNGGMFGLFSSSPKKKEKEKEKEKERPVPVTRFPDPPQHRLPDNLARYMKPDGTFARAFVAFKDVAHRCDTKLFETSFPLIGQRAEVGGKASTLQVGELVLQMFRLPPLPGVPPDQLPQSLDECHRGLRHVNWHKVTYYEGTLTQSGGDCRTWRRRQLRVVGGKLLAFNDVTKRVVATIDLKNAISVEDDQEGRNMMSPASGQTSRSNREYGGVERSFRLIFPGSEEICFFADTDEEKARWLDILRALVGHIPPHPLWAELLWQRQTDLKSRDNPGTHG